MAMTFSVSLAHMMDELTLESIYMPCDPQEVMVSSMEINRPGLELAGFFEFYDNTRLVVMGKSEIAFLTGMEQERRNEIVDSLFSRKAPAIIIARDMEPLPELLAAAKRYEVPLLRTKEVTSRFVARVVSYLSVELAPRVTRHGVLVEVYGEGMLITGDSGVGKSETAIELVKRGHRLIADDAVEIKAVSDKTLVGSAPANIRHFIELRGIGIINARRIFGMGAVKLTEKIDMIVQLEIWDGTKVYDRMGMDNEYAEILGVQVPLMTIPVKPGRNLAIILEVAAMNNRQKKMGYNAAQELLSNLGMDPSMVAAPKKVVKPDWESYR